MIPCLLSVLLSLAHAAPPPTRAADVHDAVRRDVRGTAASIDSIAASLAGLDDVRRAQAVESLRFLSVNCPYTRAALQLAFVLESSIADVPTEGLDPLVHADWQTLQRGLATHAALLDGLSVTLPAPAPGDALAGNPAAARSRDTLRATDGLPATAALLRAVPDLADALDAATRAQIERHSAQVELATGVARPCPRGPWAPVPGHPWTLGLQLGGWHDALRRIEPFADDPSARAAIRDAIELLDTFGAVSAPG